MVLYTSDLDISHGDSDSNLHPNVKPSSSDSKSDNETEVDRPSSMHEDTQDQEEEKDEEEWGGEEWGGEEEEGGGEEEEEGGGEEGEEEGEGEEDASDASEGGQDHLTQTDETDGFKTSYGLSRAELRKMQEELTMQEGDVEHPNQMDLRVGKIIYIVRHPSSRDMYISEVDIGEYDESRLIATRLVSSYKMEDLLNHPVVILCNIKPVDDKEIKSKTGMLLLATKTKFNKAGNEVGEYLEIVYPSLFASLGSRVYVDGFPKEDPLPTKDEEFFDFVMKDFTVDSNMEVVWRGQPLKVEGCPDGKLVVQSLKDTYCKLE